MKKNHLFFLILITLSSITFSQELLNPGFEWWNMEHYFDEPEAYHTTNFHCYSGLGYGNVSKSTDSYSGTYAVRLETMDAGRPMFGAIATGVIGEDLFENGIPFGSRPETMKGFAKYSVVPGDSAFIIAIFKKQGEPIAMVYHVFTGSSDIYQFFEETITWSVPDIYPDTLMVFASSSNFNGMQVVGSVLMLDEMIFTNSDDPFPNGDFENWEAVEAEEPEDWFTSNVFSIATGILAVTKSEESFSGNYAIRMETVENQWGDTMCVITNGYFGEEGPAGGLAIQQVPYALSGYYKYFPVGEDTALAGMSLYRFDPVSETTVLLYDTVYLLPPVEEFTPFNFQLLYDSLAMPDTLNVAFASGNFVEDTSYFGLGSVLYLDDLHISYWPSVINQSYSKDAEYDVFPNPFTEKVTFTLFNKEPVISIELYDLNGKRILVKQLQKTAEHEVVFNLDQYDRGIYAYIIRFEDGLQSGKIIKY